MSAYIDPVNLYVDGGCRGNPGPGTVAALALSENNDELGIASDVIGNTTNNRAEYHAVLLGLNLSAKHTRRRVTCFSDSQLVVNQMNGDWRLKSDKLRELFLRVRELEQVFDEVVYTYANRGNPNIKKVYRRLNEAFEGR